MTLTPKRRKSVTFLDPNAEATVKNIVSHKGKRTLKDIEEYRHMMKRASIHVDSPEKKKVYQEEE